MIEIARTGKWNPGGGRWLEIVPIALVSAYSRPIPTATATITLIDNADWTRIYCTPETLQYRISAADSDNGDIYTVEIKGLSLDDTPAKAAAIDALFLKKKCIVRFTDNDKLVRIAGTPVEYLQFSYELDTDSTTLGSRAYSLSFKGTLTKRPAYA